MNATTEKRRLSRPVSQAQPAYDAVVIGSGYGAGVAINRLARTGQSVALLERGPERIPGEFPATLTEAAKEFQLSRNSMHIGSRQGLFDLRVQEDVSVLLGCGLGGTSLINGNVMLTPETAVFKRGWPLALRDDADGALALAYERARHMLGSTPYPDHTPLQKLNVLQRQASHIGGAVTRPPINVTFDQTNASVGAVQPSCTLCGDCCSGCNVGAKNTVAMNYLPDACDHGAALFTGASVRWIEQCEDGWTIHYRDAEASEDGIETSLFTKAIYLGAGTLGSTEILLRSAEGGLPLSDRLGHGFSGNGDVIAFAYNNDMPVNGVGIGHPARPGSEPVGPVIAGLIDLRTNADLRNNIVIQEGALPSPLAPLLPAMLAGASPLFGSDTDYGDSLSEFARSLSSLARGAYRGAVANTQTFLVMAHESSQGQLRLREGEITIDWPDAGRDPVFERISTRLRQATEATGGTYIPNPIWSESLGRNLVSVHPLGGCGMADDVTEGVVDDCGRVYHPNGGHHRGLHVLDGSVIPTSLGVNPSLTITALAERAMARLLSPEGSD